MLSGLSDGELVASLLGRGKVSRDRAWEEWDRRHGETARRLAGRILRRFHLPADLVADVVQQADLKFLKYLGRLDPDRPPLPYYLRAVSSTSYDEVRSRLAEREATLRFRFLRHPLTSPDELELQDSVERLLACVPADERELLELRYLGGLGVPEIAERTGSNVARVNRRLHAGRCRLRTLGREEQA